MTGGVMQKAHADGHRVVLVTSTRGEVGEIHNMDEAENRPRLAEVRTAELAAATRILGVDRQEFLDYRDSGMAGTDDNQDPASFHRAAVDEAAEKLAKVIRQERPEVVVTYDPTGTYFHPDHIKAHQVTTAALDLLKKDGWEPRKFYWHAFPRSGLKAWAELSARPDAPEPPQFPPNMGVPDEQISFERDTYTFNYPGTPSELVAAFRSYYGPTMNAFEAAAASGREAHLQAELETLFNQQNTSEDATSIPATFLRVTVKR